MQFRSIPAGAIQLGSSLEEIASWSQTHPEFDYTLEASRPKASLAAFELQTSPVTNGEFAAFVAADGYRNEDYWEALLQDEGSLDLLATFVDATGQPGPLSWSHSEAPVDSADAPVSGISWFEATAFAAFAKARLPTDAEWEYAARNGAERSAFPWGEAFDAAHCVHQRAPADGPSAVNSRPQGQNKWGNTDLSGNIAEWVSDDVGDDLQQSGLRVIRGDFYAAQSAVTLRSTVRTPHPPERRWRGFGCRLARSISIRMPIRMGAPPPKKRRKPPPDNQ